MRYWGKLIAFVVLLAASSCAGRGDAPEPAPIALQPIGTSVVDHIQIGRSTNAISLEITNLDNEGAFFRLELPEGKTISNEVWHGDESTLHLVAPVGGTADVGIVPLRTYSGHPIRAELRLGPVAKTALSPPLGDKNQVQDLTVTYSRPGYVRLTWTEVNTGDYDFNGEVSVSDLTPLGVHFNESYERSAPNASLSQIYWIDGDHNGYITQADIVPIGANYYTTVGAYTVLQNGEIKKDPLGFFPTCRRDSELYVTKRQNLPPLYSIELAGDITDFWQVLPVDREFNDGPSPGTNTSDASLSVLNTNVAIEGALLRDLSSESLPGISGSFEILRIVDPIDIVDSYEIDERLGLAQLGTPYFSSPADGRFADVPRDQALLLEVIYAPAVDLVTGAAKTGPVTSDDIVITAIPFRLPRTSESLSPPVGDIDAQIELTAKPGGGYYVNVHTVTTMHDTVNDHDNVSESTTRLDYATGVLSRLSGPGGDYEYEAELTDEDRDGVSESHLDELLDFDIYSEYWNIGVKVTGTIAGFDEGSGVIQLGDAVQTAGNVNLGDIEVRFAELTQFGEIDPEGDPQAPDPVDPTDFQVGDDLVLGVYIYQDSPTTYKYWALTVVRQL